MSFFQLPEVKLPSNEKFGGFVSMVCVIACAYCFFMNLNFFGFVLIICAIIVAGVTYFYPHLIQPFNKLWMSFGLVLGLVVSPVVLGVIFFMIITPVAIIQRLCGRDELNLRARRDNTYWVATSKFDNFQERFDKQY